MDTKPMLIQVTVELEGLPKDQEWPQLAAYVFTPGGRLLTQAPLAANPQKPAQGQAELKLEGQPGEVVVKVGPAVDTLSTLNRYQIPLERVKGTPEKKVNVVFKLLKSQWWCWLKVPYVVTGTVEKQGALGSAPVCFGEVDIYDVDLRYCFPRLPEVVIERIREAMIDIILDAPPIIETPVWPPWGDDDWCGTGPKPPFPPPTGLVDITQKLKELPAEWAFAKDRVAALPTARSRMDTLLKKLPVAEKQALLNREAVAGVRIADVLYSNTVQFRNLLHDKFQAFRFWLCWYPWIYWFWWPYCRWYSLEYLGTATLNSDGSFSKTLLLWICRRDTPDLWFKVRQTIGGVERVIYARRPVPCHTYWNHASGDPVHLHVTDPEAVACDPEIDPGGAGVYVMAWGVGWDKWYSVTQAHRKPPAPGDPLPPVDPNRGLYNGTDPYATTLHLRMQFHDQLRAQGVQYYRWSYRKEGSGAAWTHIATPIFHNYLTINSAGKPIIDNEKIGPYPAPTGTETDLFLVPDPAKDWLYDRVFAIWNTQALADGNYELYLEMFDTNGVKIADPAAAGFTYFLPTGPAPSPVDDELYLQSGGIVFQIHIDNTPTRADVQKITLGATPDDVSECQFIAYTDPANTVAVTYRAYHLNGYLDHYDLAILRGISATQVVPPPDPALPLQIDPAGAPTGAVITKTYTAGHLLRLVGLYGPHTQCTFAVELHTWPRHRDGYVRIRDYEAHDTATFALVQA